MAGMARIKKALLRLRNILEVSLKKECSRAYPNESRIITEYHNNKQEGNNKTKPHCMYRGFLKWRSRRDTVGLQTKDGEPS